jgi:two-component system cell cycle sensor histidine kinase PleC
MAQSRLVQNIDTDHEILRCVTDTEGRLIYISPALSWSVGQSRNDLMKLDLSRIARLYTPEGVEVPIENIKPGFYDAALERMERDPQLLSVRVDSVQRGESGFCIFWFDQDGQRFLQDETWERSERLVERVEALGEIRGQKPKQAPRIENINIDDSELRHFINLSNELFGVYRREGSFVRVNYAFNRLLGYTDQDLRKFPFIHLIHPEDQAFAKSKMKLVIDAPLENETRVAFECRSICKDGHFKWIEWVLKSAEDHIYIVGRDVTDIRNQEVELDFREQQLSEAQKIGRMGHWSWDVGNREIDWSHQIYRIFDVKETQFKPSFENIDAFLSKKDLPDLYQFFQKAVLEKRDYNIEFRIIRADKETRYLRCEGRCHINEKTGQVDKLFGIIQDITERTLHERQLHEAKEAAEGAYASKTRFLANMSHELRTPLNAIIGFSEMMQRQLLGPIGNAKYLDYVAGIRESGEHLLDLINDILDMSKIEVGKYDLEFENVNLAKIIRLVIHMMQGRAHESEVRILSDHVADDVHIYADRRAVMQVLLNLMSNAVKFTPPGGTVEVSCERKGGDMVSFTVSDTGVGIPKSKIPIITRPFEQVASALTRPHEGSGLGLAITKDLIELHNGDMKIVSKVNEGTQVSVSLPVAQAGASESSSNKDGNDKGLDSGYAIGY